jgi:S1-C subfamily serine protease
MPKQKDYKKIIGFWALVFLVGGVAGLLFGQFLIPWLATVPSLSKIGWICNVKEGTTIINKTEKIYLTQDSAYQEAIAKIANSVVAVRSERSGKIATENSGFILTSDGLVATSDSISKGRKIFIVKDNKEYEAQIIKQDKENNLALLKINEANLPVVSFGESDNLKLGEMVFLVGAVKEDDAFNEFTNIGFIKTLAPEITFTFSETSLASGASLSNIKGEVLGLCLIDKNGNVKLVEAEKIRELMK